MKNFVGEDSDIIEIVSSDSAMGALKNAGIKSIRVCLPLLLSFGNLLDLNNYSRDDLRKIYDIDDYIPFENGFNFKKEIELLSDAAKHAKKIRIWSSHLNCEEYCLLLYICSLFKDKQISVVFAEELNWYCKSISMTNKEEVIELLKREHILTREEVDDYVNKWNEVFRENAELRHVVNGEVIGTSIDYFDKQILECLRDSGEIKLNAFIGELIANSVIDDFGDLLYSYLINRLIDDKKIALKVVDDTKYIRAVY